MAKIFATLFIFTIITIFGIAVMIHGWGLRVESWGWIFGGAVVNLIAASIVGIVQAIDNY